MNRFLFLIFAGFLALTLSGCLQTRFEYHPAELEPQQDRMLRQILVMETVDVELITRQTPRIHAKSRWQMVGRLPLGGVYRPIDTTFTLVDDQVFDAFIIVDEETSQMKGIFVPLKRSFIQIDPPIQLRLHK